MMTMSEIQSLPTAALACGHETGTSYQREGNVRVYGCDLCDYVWQSPIVVTQRVEHRTFPVARTVLATYENGVLVDVQPA